MNVTLYIEDTEEDRYTPGTIRRRTSTRTLYLETGGKVMLTREEAVALGNELINAYDRAL